MMMLLLKASATLLISSLSQVKRAKLQQSVIHTSNEQPTNLLISDDEDSLIELAVLKKSENGKCTENVELIYTFYTALMR